MTGASKEGGRAGRYTQSLVEQMDKWARWQERTRKVGVLIDRRRTSLVSGETGCDWIV